MTDPLAGVAKMLPIGGQLDATARARSTARLDFLVHDLIRLIEPRLFVEADERCEVLFGRRRLLARGEVWERVAHHHETIRGEE
ncbi:hypothetical protein [Kutzneria sp. 744]|uniref:hypothetical protein n=1 Tax=Kutzneria sp. (strain 744) TaxID=345341 RepID=UPI0003EEBDF0|nr:hypothetical protein [Kutzneria sp. 744]EWM12519.1 hypothetical protein KUTG_02823 [Kutzneria sp. 744]